MKNVCPKCSYKGNGKYVATDSFRLTFGGFFLGIAFLFLAYADLTKIGDSIYIILWVFVLALLAIALYLTISYYNRNKHLCPKCKYGLMDPQKVRDESLERI